MLGRLYMVTGGYAADTTTNLQIHMPTPNPYIPTKDSEFQIWFANFNTLITANPTNYGLITGDATAIGTKYTAWNAAYITATTPATRTSANIAAKDAARYDAEGVIRPYAQRIRANGSVSDALKVGLGLNLQPSTLTPIPAPTVQPELLFRSATPLQFELSYKDPGASGKAKPYGVRGVQIVTSVGTAVAVDPDAAPMKAMVTKAPFRLSWDAAQIGKIATIWARYYTVSGPGGAMQFGPWSTALSSTII
jgi:hypothetical protein